MSKKIVIFITVSIALLFTGLVIRAREAIACSFVEYSSFVKIDKNVYVAPDTRQADRYQLLSLIGEAKMRVAKKYPGLTSTPVIIAAPHMEALKWFTSNEYASTQMLPGQAYIVVGPLGHNTDIIAHEIVHSGMFEQIGYWTRFSQIPVWFDEGVAMQVDYRQKYSLSRDDDKPLDIESLQYGWQFFRGDNDELTNHYALAKLEIERWLGESGDERLLSLLRNVKSGNGFEDAYHHL